MPRYGLPVRQSEYLRIPGGKLLRLAQQILLKGGDFLHNRFVFVNGFTDQIVAIVAVLLPIRVNILPKILDGLHIVIAQGNMVLPPARAERKVFIGHKRGVAGVDGHHFILGQGFGPHAFQDGALIVHIIDGVVPVQVIQIHLSLKLAQAHCAQRMAGCDNVERAPFNAVVVPTAPEHILSAAGEKHRVRARACVDGLAGVVDAELPRETKVDADGMLLPIQRRQRIGDVRNRAGQHHQIVEQ